MLGRDLTAKQLNRKVINFLDKLFKLQKEADDLIETIEDYSFNGFDRSKTKTGAEIINYDEYTYYFKQITNVLNELSNFDLEDSVEEERYK